MIVTAESNDYKITDINPDNIAKYGACGYKDEKQPGLIRKIEWVREYFPKGLRIKGVVLRDGGYQGMIEYLPIQHAHRPVEAPEDADYLFINCLFVGFKKKFKGKGYGEALVKVAVEDAKKSGSKGVAVVTRNGSLMVSKDIFLKNGFVLVETAKPDFELLVLKFDAQSPNPKFRDMKTAQTKYEKGLFLLRSAQCPYTEKNVRAILESAKTKFGIDPILVELDSYLGSSTEAGVVSSSMTCPFGVFCLIHNGVVIGHHPISQRRFENIMQKRLK